MYSKWACEMKSPVSIWSLTNTTTILSQQHLEKTQQWKCHSGPRCMGKPWRMESSQAAQGSIYHTCWSGSCRSLQERTPQTGFSTSSTPADQPARLPLDAMQRCSHGSPRESVHALERTGMGTNNCYELVTDSRLTSTLQEICWLTTLHFGHCCLTCDPLVTKNTWSAVERHWQPTMTHFSNWS
jgi:hypothetical protein